MLVGRNSDRKSTGETKIIVSTMKKSIFVSWILDIHDSEIFVSEIINTPHGLKRRGCIWTKVKL